MISKFDRWDRIGTLARHDPARVLYEHEPSGITHASNFKPQNAPVKISRPGQVGNGENVHRIDDHFAPPLSGSTSGNSRVRPTYIGPAELIGKYITGDVAISRQSVSREKCLFF
jgi:hypothetical protein